MIKKNKIAVLFKSKTLRRRLLLTLFILFMVRVLTQISIPWVNSSYIRNLISNNPALSFYNLLTGGGMENFSVLSLSITPFISASIVIQLLMVVFPSLENLQRSGDSGQKIVAKYTQYIALAMAILQSIIMAFTFKKTFFISNGWLPIVTISLSLIAGYSILLWLSGIITKYGVGNGFSLILLINILSKIPSDFYRIYKFHIAGKGFDGLILLAFIILFLLILTILSIILNEATLHIPIQYAGRLGGSNKLESSLPLKMNTSNIMPVIFASTMISLPALAISLSGYTPKGVLKSLYYASIQDYWFIPSMWKLSIGYFVYIGLLIFFAYYYTEISFNPMEIADNFKKGNTTVEGVRPGEETVKYLENVTKPMILLGAVFLAGLCTLPMIVSGFAGLKLSLGGTTLIIVVSILIETINQLNVFIESEKETMI